MAGRVEGPGPRRACLKGDAMSAGWIGRLLSKFGINAPAWIKGNRKGDTLLESEGFPYIRDEEGLIYNVNGEGKKSLIEDAETASKIWWNCREVDSTVFARLIYQRERSRRLRAEKSKRQPPEG